jgi:hypothetical protein
MQSTGNGFTPNSYVGSVAAGWALAVRQWVSFPISGPVGFWLEMCGRSGRI